MHKQLEILEQICLDGLLVVVETIQVLLQVIRKKLVKQHIVLVHFAMLGNISGRIVYLSIACNGAPNELGFIRQDWYNADSNGFGYGENYLKKDWWGQAKKSKMNFRYGHLPGHPEIEIEVATASYADSAPEGYVPDINLTTTVGGTLLLAAVLFVGSRGGI